MAHNLEIRNGQASMMYVGESPWHGLGTRLDQPATAVEAIQAARLDWEVMKLPLSVQDDRYRLSIRDRFGMVRKDLWGTDQAKVLGIVGKSYTPLQNRDAFKFFDPIVGEDAAVYHTAGVLGDGERVWILAKLPEDMRVIGDDIAHKYLLLSNSHNGTSAVQVKFTPIRVVCQNTLTLALNQGPTFRIFHTRDLPQRMQQASDMLGIIRQRFDEIEQTFQTMTQVKMNRSRLDEYFQMVFPDPVRTESEKALRRVAENRIWAEQFFDQGKGNRLPGVAGTLWAAYNGVAELVDHRPIAKTPDRHLNSIWFNDGYYTKARAYRLAKEMTPVWAN